MVAYPDPQAGLKARTVVNTWIESLLRYCASTRAVTAGISLLGLAWLGALISPAAAQTAEEEIAAAARPFGGFKQSYGGSDDGGSRLFQDTVDPFTGTLQAHIKPIEVPGNGGLNISVGLAYRMEGLRNTGSSRLSASSSAMFEDTPWSPGAWLLAVAPKVVFRADGTTNPTGVYSLCTPPPGAPAGAPYGFARIFLESADGRPERLFRTAAGQFETATRWRLTCAGTTHVLTSPAGLVYTLGDKTKVQKLGYTIILQTTRVTDLSGNYYDISYTPITVVECSQSSIHSSGAIRVPSTIAASDGRTITFSYDSGNGNCAANARGPRLTSIQAPNATWSFEYYGGTIKSATRNGVTLLYRLSGQLRRVVAPDGTAHSFEYTDICPTTNAAVTTFSCGHQPLTKVTLPTGGQVGYDYRTHFDVNERGYSRYLECDGDETAGCYWNSPQGDVDPGVWNGQIEASAHVYGQPDLLRRYTSDGGSWTYTYDRAIDKAASPGTYDVTTIDGPAGRTVHRFIGLGYFTPAALVGYSRFTNVCNGHAHPAVPSSYCQMRIGGPWQVGLPVDVTTGALSVESYAFVPRVLTTQDSQTAAGRVLLSDGAQVLVPDLQRKTFVVDGATYETIYSNHDQYGNPGTVTQSGPNNGNRTSALTYLNDTSKWIIGKVKDEVSTAGSTARSFDANGKMISFARNGVTTAYTYNSEGNIATIRYPRGLLHTLSSYKRGIARGVSQPESVTISRVVDDAGNITSEIDGEGHATGYSYDGLGRLTSIDYPRGTDASITHTSTSKTMTRGAAVETTTYDGFSRPISISRGGVTHTFRYDSLGRRTFESNPNSTIGVQYAYDALGRLTRLTNPDSTFREFVYGPANLRFRDERSNNTIYSYRAYGDPRTTVLMGITTANLAANITIVRGADDLISSVTQAGLTRSYGYDSRKYITSYSEPEASATTFERDAAGNMTARTVAGVRADYVYDGHNRLTGISYSDGTPAESRSYSRTGRLRTVSSAGVARVLNYDANDNLTGESLTAGSVVMNAQYGYDGDDQLSSTTYPVSNRLVSYSPDALGRPTQASGYITSVSYWPSGLPQQIQYANGVTEEFEQNSRLWPNGLHTRRGSVYYASSAYGYDGVGNVISISDAVDTSRNRTLGYDNLDRLTNAAGPWGAGTISYDGAGNINSQNLGSFSLSYSYDTNNRLTSVAGSRSASYAYDSRGNLAARSGVSYSHDLAGDLRCADCTSPNRTDYTYDGMQRVAVTKAGVTTYEFRGSSGELLAEYTPSVSNRLVEHIYLNGKLIAQRTSDNRPSTAVTVRGAALVNNAGEATIAVNIGGTSPTGTVTFSEGGIVLGTAYVIDGQASISVLGMAFGAHTITVNYSGDAVNSGNVVTLQIKVVDLAWLPAVLDLILN